MGYWEVIEPYWEKLKIYDGPKAFERTFAVLPPTVQTLISAHWCESEISNGGFEQFFSNPTGVLAPEAQAAFRELGLADVADLVRDAMALLGSPYPRDLGRRTQSLSQLSKRAAGSAGAFETLDERFYSLTGVGSTDPGSQRLWAAMATYAEGSGRPGAGRRTMQ